MNKGILVFVFVFLLIGFVSATDTAIKVKTVPNDQVQVVVYDAHSSDFHLYQKFIETSNIYGDVNVTFSSTVEDFKIMIYVKSFGKSIADSRSSDIYSAGESIYIEVFPDGFTPVETPNETTTETVAQTQETNNSISENVTDNSTEVSSTPVTDSSDKSSFTGLATLGSTLFSTPTVYYFIGGIIIVLVAIFFVVRKKGGNDEYGETRPPKEIIVRKLSEVQAERAQVQSVQKSEALKHAEARLNELQNEVNKLRRDDQSLKETEQKIRENRELIRRLKGNDGNQGNNPGNPNMPR
ncbi:MAG: hypothetical protein Q7S56_01145 [Nanoarchaeota archaeon]|nr:hypothetical protein [Nanoarchaeota archaeon]